MVYDWLLCMTTYKDSAMLRLENEMETVSNSLETLLNMPEQRNMSDRLFNQISELIQNGKLPAGYVFPNETVLCQQLSVGRSSIREAYKALELAGYITRSKRGTVVNKAMAILEATPLKSVAQHSSAEDFLEFRLMLEEQTSSIAAQKSTAEEIELLREILDKLDEAQKNQDVDQMCELDVAFHTGIAKASHNNLIIASMAAVASIWKQETEKNFRQAMVNKSDIFDRMNRQHRGILDAISCRDSETASSRMQEHILDMSKLLL